MRSPSSPLFADQVAAVERLVSGRAGPADFDLVQALLDQFVPASTFERLNRPEVWGGEPPFAEAAGVLLALAGKAQLAAHPLVFTPLAPALRAVAAAAEQVGQE